MITNIEFLNYQDHISDLMSEGYLSRQQGFKLIDDKYEELNIMTPTKSKIQVMQAYEDGKTIKIHFHEFTKQGIPSVTYMTKSEGCCDPVWNWSNKVYSVQAPPVEFFGYVNVSDVSNYKGSTVFQTQEQAEDHTVPATTRTAVRVKVTETDDGQC